jgi:hypothetical protein
MAAITPIVAIVLWPMESQAWMGFVLSPYTNMMWAQ